jgi:hypothetical protein
VELTIDQVGPGILGCPSLPSGFGFALANPNCVRDDLVGEDLNLAVRAFVRGIQYHHDKCLLLVVQPGLESLLPKEEVVFRIVMAISPHEIEGRIIFERSHSDVGQLVEISSGGFSKIYDVPDELGDKVNSLRKAAAGMLREKYLNQRTLPK